MRSSKFLFFWEKDCPHCKRAYPALKKAIRMFPSHINFITVDVSQNSYLKELYSVRGTPTLVVDKDGYDPISIEGVLTTKGYLGYFDGLLEEKVYQ